MEALKHFSHDHPLILLEKGKDDVDVDVDEEVSCYGCREVVIDHPAYSCSQCKFFLHKSCAELPQKILHFYHPRHPLTLVSKNPYKNTYGECWSCDSCFSDVLGFSYHCPICPLNLDIKCASVQKFIEAEGHEHSFVMLRPLGLSLNCEACGDRIYETIYICTTCQLYVHEECTSLPFTVKHMGHEHEEGTSSPLTVKHMGHEHEEGTSSPLTVKHIGHVHEECTSWPLTVKHIGHEHQLKLTYSIKSDYYSQLGDFEDPFCKICYCKVKADFWVYYCASCTYVAHLSCATSEPFRDDAFAMESQNEECRSCTVISLNMNQIATEIEHFSHKHCLTLMVRDDEAQSDDQFCDGCTELISGPFYSCVQCNFLLHKSCADLPRKKLHPFHYHSLTLLSESLWYNNRLFKCGSCNMYCNGFVYVCETCDFYLCLKCNLFLDTFKHDNHEHVLSLNLESFDTKCNACGVDCQARFRCEACDFNLDFQCASFPPSVDHECNKHGWGIRPLNLTFSSVEHESGEYYCDVCEDLRGQNHWFYDCEDCDHPIHPKCVLKKNLIKFERTHVINNHPHPLTLVKNTQGHPPCSTCGDPCEDLVLVCAECNFNIHSGPDSCCYDEGILPSM